MATLRIFGDSLIPDEVSQSLGCEPTRSEFKGQVLRGSKTGRERIARAGSWRLKATDREPEDLDAQVAELLDRLTPDLEVWALLSSRYGIDLFCGFFMNQSNEGVEISAKTMAALGLRGIKLSLDIYGPIKELKESDPCPCESGKIFGDCCGLRTNANDAHQSTS